MSCPFRGIVTTTIATYIYIQYTQTLADIKAHAAGLLARAKALGNISGRILSGPPKDLVGGPLNSPF